MISLRSKITQKILNLFFLNEKEKFYINELAGKIKVKNDPKNYEVIVYCKSRIVDPSFKDGNKIKKLSQVDKNWQKILKKELKPKKYFLKFEK